MVASALGFAQAPASSAKPLTREQLLQLVAAGMDNARLLQTLEERGIGFELTGQDLQSLRKAGAQPALLKALAEAALGASHEPLKKDVLAPLVGAGADQSMLVQTIKERGIDAPFTAEEFVTLMQLGATVPLIKALRDFNPEPLKADQVLGLVTNGVASGRVAALVKR